jgi:hypothetical protein
MVNHAGNAQAAAMLWAVERCGRCRFFLEEQPAGDGGWAVWCRFFDGGAGCDGCGCAVRLLRMLAAVGRRDTGSELYDAWHA